MTPATDNLVKRSYSEVVGDILTRLIGGVVNEPIIFDVKADVYSLARPAQSVRGITGQLMGADQADDEPGTLELRELLFVDDQEAGPVPAQIRRAHFRFGLGQADERLAGVPGGSLLLGCHGPGQVRLPCQPLRREPRGQPLLAMPRQRLRKRE